MSRKVKLSDIIEVKHGFAFESKYFSEEGPVVLTPGNFHLTGGLKLTSDNCKRYSAEYSSKQVLNNGDLVIVMTDLTKNCNLLGRPAIIESNEIILHNQRIGKIEYDSSLVTKEFLYHTFLSEPYLNEIKKTATGTTVRHTSNASIYNVEVSLPSIKDQINISKILSSFDCALFTIDSILEKKTARLNFLIDSVSSGDLPKGKADSILTTLGELGDVYSGLSGKNAEDFGSGMPFITYMNVFSNSRTDIQDVGLVRILPEESQNKVQYGDIFFTVSSETPNEVGMTSVLLNKVDKMYLNSFCFGFRLKNFSTLLPEFARFYLRSQSFRSQMLKLAQGSTRFNLSKSQVMRLQIHIPKDIKKQSILAEGLDKLEQELNLLKKEHSVLSRQKLGVMRELIK